MKEKFLKFKAKCVEKYNKAKAVVSNKCQSTKAAITCGMAALMVSPIGAFAAGGITPENVQIKADASADSAINNFVGLMISISKYLGIIVIVIGATQWALAYKDTNPDGQSSAAKVVFAGIALFSIKYILAGIGVIA